MVLSFSAFDRTIGGYQIKGIKVKSDNGCAGEAKNRVKRLYASGVYQSEDVNKEDIGFMIINPYALNKNVNNIRDLV